MPITWSAVWRNKHVIADLLPTGWLVDRRTRQSVSITTTDSFSIAHGYRKYHLSSPVLEPNSTTRTPATDTTNGQVQQQFHNKFATSQCQSPTSRHVKTYGMWQIFVRWWCSLVVFVAGVRNRCPCSGVWLLLNSTHQWRIRKVDQGFNYASKACEVTSAFCLPALVLLFFGE